MQGFKNLLPRQLLNDDSVQPVVKKSDQHRKTTQACLQHFMNIYKNTELFCQSFEGEIFQLHHELTETQNKLPPYFVQLTQLFKNINVEVKIFSEKSNGSYRELNNVCNTLFLEYSNVVLNFQQHIRNYQALEQIVFEMSKKYSRTFKTMSTYLQSYKSSFTDARLIYNTQQKIRRYQLCQTTFKSLLQDLKGIQQKCDKLTQKKVSIRQNFLSIENEMKRTVKVVATKSIVEIKNFVKNYSDFHKTVVTFLAEKKFSLEKLNIATFFQSLPNTKFPEYFNCQIDQKQCKIYPALFVYIDNLKSQYIPYCKSAFVNYLKETTETVDKRKEINRRILDFLRLYTQLIEKHQYGNLKDIVSGFQKLKKRLSELFSSRFVSFLKSIHSIFELSIGINQKLLKSFNSKLKNIQSYLDLENKHMDMFIKQLRSNVQKFIGKKQRKTSNAENSQLRQSKQDPSFRNSDMNKSLVMQDSIIIVDNTDFRRQIKQRAQFLIHLIQGFITKLEGNQKLLKTNISSMVHDYSESSNEFYQLCCQYETIYFGSEEFINNYKKFEVDIDKTLQKETNLMREELGFKTLLQEDEESRKIVFDGEIAKVDEFKKLKKPARLDSEIKNKNQNQKSLQRKESNISDLPSEFQNGHKTPPTSSQTNGTPLRESTSLSVNSPVAKQVSSIGINLSNEKSQKYYELLCKKVTFQQGEQYIKSFSCAFYDKIILQGRLFITNRRLCFHSKFNPTNIFFGGTFIQIPKKDIIKVEKRYNALIFDNSLAVSTVNGEMFFTSFFARDEAYDLINKALEINLEEQFFEAEEDSGDKQQPQNVEQIQNIHQEDDLKPEDEQNRQQQVNKLLESFPYQIISEGEYEMPKVTAMKYFRLFDSGQQIYLNRRSYKSFLQYSKDLIGHKEIEVHHFKPNILQFLNLSNIKSNTPIKIQRKLNCMVPISAAGIPFMPKAARSDQIQALYFISKNKYIIESTIQNSGAPYTDCFNVKLKRTVESVQQNKVRFKAEMYINFAKSTMMRSMIESEALKQTKSYFVKMSDEIKKYFKNLEKARKPESSSKTGNGNASQQQSGNSEELQQMRKQLETSLQQKDKLQEKVTVLQSKESSYKQYLFISIILNVFLLLLLLN